MALGPFAAEGPELIELLGPLDAFGDDGEIQRLRQGEHGAHDGGILGVATQAGDEGVIDLRLRYPYFSRPEPLAFPVRGSYADPAAEIREPIEYGWVHDLGSIVTAVARAGLTIEFLHEFPFVPWPAPFLERHEDDSWWLPSAVQGELPLFFSLKATKPSDP